MRQGQQNRRGRGRNRKSQNPLTRSFESSGPDVKIRGTPSHIAEKYISMARDALSSGDPVLAENYLQHAEHYNRIIMTYREQQAPQGEMANGHANGRHRHQENGESDPTQQDGEEAPRGQEAQPNIESEDDGGEQQATERPQRRSNGSRNGTRRRRPENGDARAEASDNGDAQPAAEEEGEKRQPRRRAAMADADEQPDFLKRPVRRGRRPAAQAQADIDGDSDSGAATSDEAAE